MCNVLEKLCRGSAINAKDKTISLQGLVSVLRTLNHELDAAVLAPYCWANLGPTPSKQDEAAQATWTHALLKRLLNINTRLSAEDALGIVRWLRPEFQNLAVEALTDE